MEAGNVLLEPRPNAAALSSRAVAPTSLAKAYRYGGMVATWKIGGTGLSLRTWRQVDMLHACCSYSRQLKFGNIRPSSRIMTLRNIVAMYITICDRYDVVSQ